MFILVTNHHSQKKVYVNVDSICMVFQNSDHGEIQFISDQPTLLTVETAEEIMQLIDDKASGKYSGGIK